MQCTEANPDSTMLWSNPQQFNMDQQQKLHSHLTWINKKLVYSAGEIKEH